MELTKQQIERVYTDTQEDVVVKVTKKWWSEMDNYREFVNLLVESMRVSNIVIRIDLYSRYILYLFPAIYFVIVI